MYFTLSAQEVSAHGDRELGLYLQEDTHACFHSTLDLFGVVAVLDGQLMQPGAFHLADPLVGLFVRVDQQGPLLAVLHQDGILC